MLSLRKIEHEQKTRVELAGGPTKPAMTKPPATRALRRTGISFMATTVCPHQLAKPIL
jgi:hypothetical protein